MCFISLNIIQSKNYNKVNFNENNNNYVNVNLINKQYFLLVKEFYLTSSMLINILSWTKEPAKVGTCAHDRHALPQFDLDW